MRAMLADIDETVRLARGANDPQFVQLAERLWAASKALAEATDWMLARMKAEEQDKALAGATAYLALAGDVIGGHFLARAALAARGKEPDFRARQMALAGFFAETSLASAPGRVPGIIEGGDRFLDNSRALFGIG